MASNVSNSHVTVLTPVGAPGVSEDEVVLAILGSIADKVDSVVKVQLTDWVLFATGGTVEDSRLVLLEDWLVSLN